MKITLLEVKNYRSLVDVKLPLHPLTVVIGPNGAGKTTLLEIFQLLQRSSQQELSTFLIEQGGFQSVVSYSVAERTPYIKISLEANTGSPPSHLPMSYQLELVGEKVGYSIASEILEVQRDLHTLKPLRYINSQKGKIEYRYPNKNGMLEPVWDYNHLETALAQAPKTFEEAESLRARLADIAHYGFFDVTSRSIVRLPQPLVPTTRPGLNGENLYSALYNLRVSHDDVFKRIITLLEQGFPEFKKLEFPVVGYGQVTMTWHEEGKRVFYPNQLSEGTLRFLWLITALLSLPLPSMILLDEPEVSLHPELLQLLAAVLQDASARCQIFVATHSPDLIAWLQPSEVLIADKEEGQTRFTWADELDLDEWLKEYTLRDLWLMGNLGGRP